MDGTDQIHCAVQYSGGIAGLHRALGRGGEDAGKACGFPGNHVHGDGIGGHGSRVNPGLGVFHREIIDEIAGLEIVGGVKNKVQVRIAEPGVNVFRGEVGGFRLDLHFGIESSNLSCRGNGFG